MPGENSDNPFTNVVPKNVEVPQNEPLMLLGQLAEALKAGTFAGVESIRVVIVPGHTVNMGQQYKFCVQVLEDTSRLIVAYTDVLFRFYVPVDGYPVVVEFMSEGHRNCDDKAALTSTLSELMANANMRLRLSSIRTLAQDQLL